MKRNWKIEKDSMGYYLYDPKMRSPFCFYTHGKFVKHWKTRRGIERFLKKLEND